MPTKHASCLENCPQLTSPYVPQRGETALHMAARSGQAEVVRYLVQDGAQVEAKAKVRAWDLKTETEAEVGGSANL